LWLQDQKIRQAEAIVLEQKKARKRTEDKLLKSLNAQALDGARGQLATATVTVSNHPSISAPNRFWKYVVANKAFDLLHRRVASRAYFDRVESGEKVPGVVVTSVTKISCRKSK